MLALVGRATTGQGDQHTTGRAGQHMPGRADPAIQVQGDQRTPGRAGHVTTDPEVRAIQAPEGEAPALKCVSSADERA